MADDDALKPEPWEQQPGETNNAYAAFLVYRDMPRPYSLRRAAGLFYAPSNLSDEERRNFVATASQQRQMQRWSSQHRWQERVRAWTLHLLEQSGLKRQERVSQAKESAFQIGSGALNAVARWLRDKLATGELVDMSVADAMRMQDAAVRLISWSLNIPERGEAISLEVSGEVSHVVEERRARGLELIEQARQRLTLVQGGGDGQAAERGVVGTRREGRRADNSEH